jgi:hypothetical protein
MCALPTNMLGTTNTKPPATGVEPIDDEHESLLRDAQALLHNLREHHKTETSHASTNGMLDTPRWTHHDKRHKQLEKALDAWIDGLELHTGEGGEDQRDFAVTPTFW